MLLKMQPSFKLVIQKIDDNKCSLSTPQDLEGDGLFDKTLF